MHNDHMVAMCYYTCVHCLGSVFVRPNLLHILLMCASSSHQKYKKRREESILLQYTTMYHPFTKVSDLFNIIDVLRFHSLRAAGLVVCTHRPGTTAVFSYPGVQGGMKEKNAWYTLFVHAFNFRKISENRIFQ